jgi:hypothetical protein
MSKEKLVKPKYQFVEEDGADQITPVKRKIAKTMEVTETFNVFETMEYLAKMEKAIKDKEAEVDGLKKMKEAYQAELDLIESELGVQKLDVEYQREFAEKLSEEIIKQREDSGKVESPYAEQE